MLSTTKTKGYDIQKYTDGCWNHYRGAATLEKAQKLLDKHSKFKHNAGIEFRIVEEK